MSMHTYCAQDIAQFILANTEPEDNDVSNLKLQKLCYYAQGILSSMRGAPLFHERIEAWDHGPVVPALYHMYKSHGADPIPAVEEFNESIFKQSDRRALRDVLEYYAQFSPWRLRNMTHDEAPWIEAHNSGSREIPLEAMVRHFRPIIDDDYIREVYGNEAVNKAA